MTTTAAAATGGYSIPATVAIAALAVALIGCADPVALKYAYDQHAKEVGAWCYAYSRPPTAALQEECVHRAWASIPPSQYWLEHHSKIAPCRCGSGSVPAPTSGVSATGAMLAPANGSSASTDLIRTSAGRATQPSQPNTPSPKRAAELLAEFERRLADERETLKRIEAETRESTP